MSEKTVRESNLVFPYRGLDKPEGLERFYGVVNEVLEKFTKNLKPESQLRYHRLDCHSVTWQWGRMVRSSEIHELIGNDSLDARICVESGGES